MFWNSGWGMMGGWAGHMGWAGILFHLLFWIGIILLVVWIVRSLVGAGGVGRSPSARDILDKRYASGELTKKEYEQMKKDISK